MFDGDSADYTMSITVEVDDSKPDDSTSSTTSRRRDDHDDRDSLANNDSSQASVVTRLKMALTLSLRGRVAREVTSLPSRAFSVLHLTTKQGMRDDKVGAEVP
jgi:hypothetical protein